MHGLSVRLHGNGFASLGASQARIYQSGFLFVEQVPDMNFLFFLPFKRRSWIGVLREAHSFYLFSHLLSRSSVHFIPRRDVLFFFFGSSGIGVK